MDIKFYIILFFCVDYLENGRNLMLHVVLRTGSKEDFSLCKVEVTVEKPKKAGDGSSIQIGTSVFPINSLVASVKENMPSGTFVLRVPRNLPPNKYENLTCFSRLFLVVNLVFK